MEVLSFVAGFGFGALLGVLGIGYRYVTALEQLHALTPGHPAGQTHVPSGMGEADLEVGFDRETIDRGAKQIVEELAAVGRHISWEDAQAQARAMLAETMPVVR